MDRSRSLFRQCLALFVTMALVLGQVTMITPAFAADADPTTKIRHRAPGFFVPDHRIKLEADVRDREGLKLVRCYFRAAGEENFVFVSMLQTGGNTFQGILPAPSAETQLLEYLFLAVNNQNKVVKTQTFTVGKDESKRVPAWQEVSGEGTIQVSTELETAPDMVAGFRDNIALDVVESGLRFGVVAGGLYAANAAVGSTSGAAASASSAGAVTAGTGISTTAAVLGGVVAAGAVAGGAAVAASESTDSGGGSSGSGSGGSSQSGPGADCCIRTNGCPSETGYSCPGTCCCCPTGMVCDRNNFRNGCISVR